MIRFQIVNYQKFAGGEVLKITVATIQFGVKLGKPEENLEKAINLILRAKSEYKCDIVLLPEMWTTGYDLDNIAILATHYSNDFLVQLKSVCKEKNINLIAGSIPVIENNRLYNRSIYIDNNGKQVHSYDKVHLFSLMNEEKYFSNGSSAEVFDIMSVKSAIAICYDLRFSGLFSSYVKMGANIIFIPAEWPLPRLNHWRTLLIARAIEFQCFIVAANRTGSDSKNSFFGHSMIIDPWGEILVEAGTDEEISSAVIDIEKIQTVRKSITNLSDIREDLY